MAAAGGVKLARLIGATLNATTPYRRAAEQTQRTDGEHEEAEICGQLDIFRRCHAITITAGGHIWQPECAQSSGKLHAASSGFASAT